MWGTDFKNQSLENKSLRLNSCIFVALAINNGYDACEARRLYCKAVVEPPEDTLFNWKRNLGGKNQKINQRVFWWSERAFHARRRRVWAYASSFALKFSSNLVVKLHQIRTKLQIRARERLFCWGNCGFAQQNPSVFLGGELRFGVHRHAFCFCRLWRICDIIKEQPTTERLFLFEGFNGRLGQSSLSRLVAPGRSLKLGGCDEREIYFICS